LESFSQDPIGFEAGDANLYRYVGNQSTTKTDPSGLIEPIDEWIETENYFLTLGDPYAYTGTSCVTGFTAQGQNAGCVRYEITEDDRQVVIVSLELGGAVIGTVFEPVDWIVTGVEVLNHPTDPWNYAGLLPLVPSRGDNLIRRCFRRAPDGGGGTGGGLPGGLPNLPRSLRERYDSIEDAVGEVSPNGVDVLEVRRTTNRNIRNQGFTEMYRVQDSDGTVFTVFRNPSTGRYSGAHHSSH